MPVLAITVLGPFAYAENYPGKQQITASAPMCGQHLGGISGIGQDAEFLFVGNKCNRGMNQVKKKPVNYALSINPGAIASTTWAGNGGPVPVPVKPESLQPQDWRYFITLPKPDVLVTINPVHATIVGLNVQTPPYAVGIRFIYKHWDGADIPVLVDGKPATDPQTGSPVVFKGTPLGEDSRLDLEIEYSGPVRDDPDHEDAVTCFEIMMRTLGLAWSIGFPPAKKPQEVTHRSDCRAAVAWLK
jgi:hypothetical protein